MPTSTLSLSGSLTLQAPNYPPSAAQQIAQPISEISYVGLYDAQSPSLNTDGAIDIPFPIGMTACNFIYLKVQGGAPVTLYLTSDDGSEQEVPVDSLLIQYFNNKPVTDIKIARSPGVPATLTYVIAQNA